MTAREKKKRAAMIAVAYYLQQESANNLEVKDYKAWASAGKGVIMDNREMVQRHGRVLRKRA